MADKEDFSSGERGGGIADDGNSPSQGKDVGECKVCTGNGEGVKEGKSWRMKLEKTKEAR